MDSPNTAGSSVDSRPRSVTPTPSGNSSTRSALRNASVPVTPQRYQLGAHFDGDMVLKPQSPPVLSSPLASATATNTIAELCGELLEKPTEGKLQELDGAAIATRVTKFTQGILAVTSDSPSRMISRTASIRSPARRVLTRSIQSHPTVGDSPLMHVNTTSMDAQSGDQRSMAPASPQSSHGLNDTFRSDMSCVSIATAEAVGSMAKRMIDLNVKVEQYEESLRKINEARNKGGFFKSNGIKEYDQLNRDRHQEYIEQLCQNISKQTDEIEAIKQQHEYQLEEIKNKLESSEFQKRQMVQNMKHAINNHKANEERIKCEMEQVQQDLKEKAHLEHEVAILKERESQLLKATNQARIERRKSTAEELGAKRDLEKATKKAEYYKKAHRELQPKYNEVTFRYVDLKKQLEAKDSELENLKCDAEKLKCDADVLNFTIRELERDGATSRMDAQKRLEDLEQSQYKLANANTKIAAMKFKHETTLHEAKHGLSSREKFIMRQFTTLGSTVLPRKLKPNRVANPAAGRVMVRTEEGLVKCQRGARGGEVHAKNLEHTFSVYVNSQERRIATPALPKEMIEEMMKSKKPKDVCEDDIVIRINRPAEIIQGRGPYDSLDEETEEVLAATRARADRIKDYWLKFLDFLSMCIMR